MRVLYLEDEELLANAVKHNLEKRGFRVDLAKDGEVGLRKALNNHYDCMVLDILVPKVSGLEILKAVREHEINTPVIMLSALSEAEDKVKGLDEGADDYLAKPFKTVELVARMRAVMRRPEKIKSRVLVFSDLVFDMDRYLLSCGEEEVVLPTKEADLLCELMGNSGRIKQKEFLLNKIWGCDDVEGVNYVEVYISRLRKILKSIGSTVQITAIRNVGYKMVRNDV